MKRLAAILSLSLFVLLFTGCGGARGTQPAPAVPTPTPAASPLPSPSPTPVPNTLVVFIGDSITQIWSNPAPHGGVQLPYLPSVNKGIGGNTLVDMENRFAADVIFLHPALVVIDGGTNDIVLGLTLAQSTAALTNMVQTAKVNGIKVVICAQLPSTDPARPIAKILLWNTMIRDLAVTENVPLADYFSVIADVNNMPKPLLLYDGVHPDIKGFTAMDPVAVSAINNGLR